MEEGAFVWIEIPATDINRATKFYNQVLDIQLAPAAMGDYQMAMFPNQTAGGAIVQGAQCVPSSDGSIAYLNAGADLATPLAKIEGAGGKVIMEKTLISAEHGYMALFIDTEGNRVGLWSKN